MYWSLKELFKNDPVNLPRQIAQLGEYQGITFEENQVLEPIVRGTLAGVFYDENIDSENLLKTYIQYIISILLGNNFNIISYVQLTNIIFRKAEEYVKKSTSDQETWMIPEDDIKYLAAEIAFRDISLFTELLTLKTNRERYITSVIENFILTINGYYADLKPKDGTLYSSWNRGIDSYPRSVNQSLIELIQSMLNDSPGNKVSVLDVGLGDGKLLADLKKNFGEMIETAGIGIENYYFPWVDQQWVMPAEIAQLGKEKYDLIVSNFALGYCLFPIIVFEKICFALKVSGTAVLEFPLSSYGTGSGIHYDFRDFITREDFGSYVLYQREQFDFMKNQKNGRDHLDRLRNICNTSEALEGMKFDISLAQGGSSFEKIPVQITRLA